jgi:hypothetical protein
MAMTRTQGRTGCGLVRTCLAVSEMASQTPGSRTRRTLTLLGFIVLILHCRPWSYAWFHQASESGRENNLHAMSYTANPGRHVCEPGEQMTMKPGRNPLPASLATTEHDDVNERSDHA